MTSDVTQILDEMVEGNSLATDRLLPAVYNELKLIADRMMRQERVEHTLQSTALVHEAYMRLVGDSRPEGWDGRGHFFAAAAEAMRRILVEHARRKLGKKRGGDLVRKDVDAFDELATYPNGHSPEFVLEVHDAIEVLASQDSSAAELIKLRFFAGLSVVDAAEVLGISKSTAYANWAYSKGLLGQLLTGDCINQSQAELD